MLAVFVGLCLSALVYCIRTVLISSGRQVDHGNHVLIDSDSFLVVTASALAFNILVLCAVLAAFWAWPKCRHRIWDVCMGVILLHVVFVATDILLGGKGIDYLRNGNLVNQAVLVIVKPDVPVAVAALLFFSLTVVPISIIKGIIFCEERTSDDAPYAWTLLLPLTCCFSVLTLHLVRHFGMLARRQFVMLVTTAERHAASVLVLSALLPRHIAAKVLVMPQDNALVSQDLVGDRDLPRFAEDVSSLTFVVFEVKPGALGRHDDVIVTAASRMTTILDELRIEFNASSSRLPLTALGGVECPVDRVDVSIGTYVASVGRPLHDTGDVGPHCFVGCSFALAALSEIFHSLPVLRKAIRVGISSGKAMGGSVNMAATAFAYFGDPLHVAKALAKSADWGDIQISPSAHARLVREKMVDQVVISSRGVVNMPKMRPLYVRYVHQIVEPPAKDPVRPVAPSPAPSLGVNRQRATLRKSKSNVSLSSAWSDGTDWTDGPLSGPPTPTSSIVPALSIYNLHSSAKRSLSGTIDDSDSGSDSNGSPVMLTPRSVVSLSDNDDPSPRHSPPVSDRGRAKSLLADDLHPFHVLDLALDKDRATGAAARALVNQELYDVLIERQPRLLPVNRARGTFRLPDAEVAFSVANRLESLALTRVACVIFALAHFFFIIYSLALVGPVAVKLGVQLPALVVDIALCVVLANKSAAVARRPILCFVAPVVGSTLVMSALYRVVVHWEASRGTVMVGICIVVLAVAEVLNTFELVAVGCALLFTTTLIGIVKRESPVEADAAVPLVLPALTIGVVLFIFSIYAGIVALSKRRAFGIVAVSSREAMQVNHILASVLPLRLRDKVVDDVPRDVPEHFVESEEIGVALAAVLLDFPGAEYAHGAKVFFSKLAELNDAFDDICAELGAEKLTWQCESFRLALRPAFKAVGESGIELREVFDEASPEDLADRLQRAVVVADRMNLVAASHGIKMAFGLSVGPLKTGLVFGLDFPVFCAWGKAISNAQIVLESATPGTVVVAACDLLEADEHALMTLAHPEDPDLRSIILSRGSA